MFDCVFFSHVVIYRHLSMFISFFTPIFNFLFLVHPSFPYSGAHPSAPKEEEASRSSKAGLQHPEAKKASRARKEEEGGREKIFG